MEKYKKYKLKYLKIKNMYGGDNNYIILDDANDEDIEKFRQKLLLRPENWLVFYANSVTSVEQIRFANENWVFCNIFINDSRVSIKCDINFTNIKKIAKNFSNCFDYICFDWRIDSITDKSDKPEDLFEFTFELLKLLKRGGKILFTKPQIETLHNFDGEDGEDEHVKITYINALNTPYGEGKGGGGGYDPLFAIISTYKSIKSIYGFDDGNVNIQNIRNIILEYDRIISVLDKICNQPIGFIIYAYKECAPLKEFHKKISSDNQLMELLKEEFYYLLRLASNEWKLPNEENKGEVNQNLLIVKK